MGMKDLHAKSKLQIITRLKELEAEIEARDEADYEIKEILERILETTQDHRYRITAKLEAVQTEIEKILDLYFYEDLEEEEDENE
jgi:hypothetical protein